MPPSLGRVMDGASLEDVLFFRDDMVRWPGVSSAARTSAEATGCAHQLGRELSARHHRSQEFDSDAMHHSTDQSLLLRRGCMYDPSSTATPPLVPPRAVILTPAVMFLVRDQAVPRSGVQADRYVRRARWIDGPTYTWMARRVKPGKGEGSSGLAFDVIEGPLSGDVTAFTPRARL